MTIAAKHEVQHKITGSHIQDTCNPSSHNAVVSGFSLAFF